MKYILCLLAVGLGYTNNANAAVSRSAIQCSRNSIDYSSELNRENTKQSGSRSGSASTEIGYGFQSQMVRPSPVRSASGNRAVQNNNNES